MSDIDSLRLNLYGTSIILKTVTGRNFMAALIKIIDLIFDIYLFIIIAQVLVSWLIAFDVLNVNNPQARNLVMALKRMTDPVYKPLRKFTPPIGGIDITPIIVILGLSFIESALIELLWTLS